MARKQIVKPTQKKVNKPKIKKDHPIDWDAICERVADFVSDNPFEYQLLGEDFKSLIVGKRVLLTTILKNENNIFQPLDINPTTFHYKYCHIYNIDKKFKLPCVDSPRYFPTTPELAISYLVNFR